MTQKELNKFWESIEDHDDSYDEFEKFIEDNHGLTVGEFDYCGPDADTGGTYGIEDLMDLLNKHGFTCLEDPAAENMCNLGWVVFPPKS